MLHAHAQMGNDEEDDYMGDLSRFLQPHDLLPAVNPSVQVDASGLSKQQKKKLKLSQQQKAEDHHRTEGLGSAISSTNKGFKMLQQMGYKPGTALGKHEQGSLEPIKVDVKRSRSGLGRDHVERAQEQFKARIADFKHELKIKKQAELKIGFQERRKSSWQGRKLISDYRKARLTLQHLEEAKSCTERGGHNKRNVSENSESKNLLDDNKEEGVDNPEDDKRYMLEQSESKNLLDDNEEEGVNNPEDDSEEEIELQDLQELLQRLRAEYFYCLYCGCQYETVSALLANCPGLEEDDH